MLNAAPDPTPALRYFAAVYADPEAPGHVTVESGTFGNRAMPSTMDIGDYVLIYCTASYTQFAKSAPGVGRVTRVDPAQKRYWYDYEPFAEPVPLEVIRLCLTGRDAQQFANIRYNWLFQISRESFASIMQSATQIP
ncbi:MAG: hypothetical protein WD533_06080, partial [Dehalococcoidia bacterium]